MTEKMPTGHGGYRPGAGRKKGSKASAPSASKQTALEAYNESRARREAALASLAELELQERERSLLPVELVERHWQALAANTRAKLLNLPGRLAASVMGVQTIQEAERQAMALIREALQELSESGVPGQP